MTVRPKEIEQALKLLHERGYTLDEVMDFYNELCLKKRNESGS